MQSVSRGNPYIKSDYTATPYIILFPSSLALSLSLSAVRTPLYIPCAAAVAPSSALVSPRNSALAYLLARAVAVEGRGEGRGRRLGPRIE